MESLEDLRHLRQDPTFWARVLSEAPQLVADSLIEAANGNEALAKILIRHAGERRKSIKRLASACAEESSKRHRREEPCCSFGINQSCWQQIFSMLSYSEKVMRISHVSRGFLWALQTETPWEPLVVGTAAEAHSLVQRISQFPLQQTVRGWSLACEVVGPHGSSAFQLPAILARWSHQECALPLKGCEIVVEANNLLGRKQFSSIQDRVVLIKRSRDEGGRIRDEGDWRRFKSSRSGFAHKVLRAQQARACAAIIFDDEVSDYPVEIEASDDVETPKLPAFGTTQKVGEALMNILEDGNMIKIDELVPPVEKPICFQHAWMTAAMKQAKTVTLALFGAQITDEPFSERKTSGSVVSLYNLKVALAEIGKHAREIQIAARLESNVSGFVCSLIRLRGESLQNFGKVTTEVKKHDQSSEVMLLAVRNAPDHLMSGAVAIAENSRRASGHGQDWRPKRSLSDGEVFVLSENPCVWLGHRDFVDSDSDTEVFVEHGSEPNYNYVDFHAYTQLAKRYRTDFPKGDTLSRQPGQL